QGRQYLTVDGSYSHSQNSTVKKRSKKQRDDITGGLLGQEDQDSGIVVTDGGNNRLMDRAGNRAQTPSVVLLSKFLATDPEVPGSIPSTSRFSVLWWLGNPNASALSFDALPGTPTED
ncbi:unnamed protein product, partial [Timema podura]|nr:unnamed protein product [Timema podura]